MSIHCSNNESIEKGDSKRKPKVFRASVKRSESIKPSKNSVHRSFIDQVGDMRPDNLKIVQRRTKTRKSHIIMRRKSGTLNMMKNSDESLDSEMQESIAYLTNKDLKHESSQYLGSPTLTKKSYFNDNIPVVQRQINHRPTFLGDYEDLKAIENSKHLDFDESFVGGIDDQDNKEEDASNIFNIETNILPSKSVIQNTDFYKRQTSLRMKSMKGFRPISNKLNSTVLVRYDPTSKDTTKEDCRLDYKQSSNELYAKGYRATAELGK